MGDRRQESLSQAEHVGFEDGENIEAKRVAVYEWNGQTWQRSGNGVGTDERYDYAGNPIYVGSAAIGTNESDPHWTITAYDLTSSSNASAKVAASTAWSNRASGVYI